LRCATLTGGLLLELFCEFCEGSLSHVSSPKLW
jgi:hypothetical protein